MKKILPILLCLILLVGTLPASAQAAETDITDEGAQITSADEGAEITIEEIKADDATLAPIGYTIPSEAGFRTKLSAARAKYPHGGTWAGVYYEDGTAKAWTCHGYAVQLIYDVFGAKYYNDGIFNYIDYSVDGISAGDLVRIDWNSHSVFITKVTDSGYYYTDANFDNANGIEWDVYISKEDLQSRFYYKVHLPGNSLKGQDPTHTIAYNSNGGSGSISSSTLRANEKFTPKKNTFTREGYSFAGYIVKRGNDNTYLTADNGWQTEAVIRDNNYTYKLCSAGSSYTLDKTWLGSTASNTTYTFYAQWLPDTSTVEFMANYSGYNYILGSDLGSGYGDSIFSRNTGVYTLSVDKTETYNNCHSLKVVGKSAGSPGKDLAIRTSTNAGYGDGYSQAGPQGDNKQMTLSVSIKSPASGAKLYIRWGYQSNSAYQSITLSKGWKTYTIPVNKNNFFGATLHPYFDQAGTYYINSLSLTDGAANTAVAPESGQTAAKSQTVARGGALTELPTPEREGYTFLGWYTAAQGGTQVTAATPITAAKLRLYAHWQKQTTLTPVSTVISNGHAYELYDNALSWTDAEAFCEALGGHLLTVDSYYENDVAYRMISDRQSYCWLGLSYDSSSKGWQWVTEEPYFFNYWCSNTGSDAKTPYAMLYPMDLNGNACAAKWDKTAGGDDRSAYGCYLNSCFICEYDAPVFLGDADGSGTVDLMDATQLQRSHARVDTGIPLDILLNGDVDRSGDLEVTDATWIQRSVAEMEIPYSVGEIIRKTVIS